MKMNKDYEATLAQVRDTLKTLQEEKVWLCCEVDELGAKLKDRDLLTKRIKKTEAYVGLAKHLSIR